MKRVGKRLTLICGIHTSVYTMEDGRYQQALRTFAEDARNQEKPYVSWMDAIALTYLLPKTPKSVLDFSVVERRVK